MTTYKSFSGLVTSIEDFWETSSGPTGCFKLMNVQDSNANVVNFVISPCTYFVDHEIIYSGSQVTGFYDGDAPVPLIYPPQLRAHVMALNTPGVFVAVDNFNADLVSSDGLLKLNIGPFTQITLQNGQPFSGTLSNRDLIVIYGPTTRSIPAQTTPYRIIVLCGWL